MRLDLFVGVGHSAVTRDADGWRFAVGCPEMRMAGIKCRPRQGGNSREHVSTTTYVRGGWLGTSLEEVSGYEFRVGLEICETCQLETLNP
jgi:hypothetical protein